MVNVAAFTEPTPGIGYPAYISINHADMGTLDQPVTVSVRQRTILGDRSAVIDMTFEQFKAFVADSVSYIARAERAARIVAKPGDVA